MLILPRAEWKARRSPSDDTAQRIFPCVGRRATAMRVSPIPLPLGANEPLCDFRGAIWPQTIGTAMFGDYTVWLWLLKLGALLNLYFLVGTAAVNADAYVVVPAQIFLVVSLYRCLFPVRYEHYVVFHDSVLSSVFATRVLATFAEVAYIFLFACVLQLLNVENVSWVNGLAWLMVLQVVICQVCVWVAILTERFEFYFYEELGWVFMFVANTIASAYLYLTVGTLAGREILLELNLVFGVVYLPFQVINLVAVRAQAKKQGHSEARWTLERFATGLRRSIRVKNPRTDAASWGGIVGLLWMTGYWATLLPMWVYYIIRVLSPDWAMS